MRSESTSAPATAGPDTATSREAPNSARAGAGWVGRAALALVGPTAAGTVGVLAGVSLGLRGEGSLALNVLCSPVFLIVLAAELVVWPLWSTRAERLGDRLIYLLPGGLALGGLSECLLPGAQRTAFLAGSVAVVVALTYLLQFVYRHKQLDARSMRFVLEASLLAVIAAAGWFLWAFEGSALVAGATGVAAALVVARSGIPVAAGGTGERIPWLLRPRWAVGLLLFTFLAEFFLGALLDLEVAGRGFLQFIPFVPATGPTGTRLLLEMYDGLWFGSAILASAWFLVALGVTMGGLVLLRMREVHVPAQRYRMGLMIGVFALAAVYVPSLASSTPLVSNRTLATLPVVGWGFGLRAGGPFESGIFLAVLVMYATVGVLTVLFGRKALCSVMCGAAMMYQGTTMHEMRAFNQTSRVGQYYLGSRLSTAYVIASTLALVSLFAVSLLAYLHRLPTVQVASGQFDEAALPLPIELYFGGLWFAMFVATPYVGTYNCATTGICHWGSLSVPFAKVSFFRLRVKDRSVCERCTTFDCAKACPVGLVDMPLYFRTKGEYRSTKCCGVGDCVGACPYGNLYHTDVRSRIARLFPRPAREHRGTPLPMVAPTTPRHPATVELTPLSRP